MNPLALTLTIPGQTDTATHDTPDSDLRRTIPAYTRVGGYLGSVLVAEINSGRGSKVFASYGTAEEIEQEFRFQFMNYARNSAPFDRYQDCPTAHAYRKKLLRHVDACILAYIAIKLFSVVPNSMAEERTVSNFTQLNTASRSRQNPRTLVQMTQIKQHHQRAKVRIFSLTTDCFSSAHSTRTNQRVSWLRLFGSGTYRTSSRRPVSSPSLHLRTTSQSRRTVKLSRFQRRAWLRQRN